MSSESQTLVLFNLDHIPVLTFSCHATDAEEEPRLVVPDDESGGRQTHAVDDEYVGGS